MSQITINLPDAIAEDLARASREANQSPAMFAEELVRRALGVRKLRDARAKLVKRGRGAGFETDEDVFKVVS